MSIQKTDEMQLLIQATVNYQEAEKQSKLFEKQREKALKSLDKLEKQINYEKRRAREGATKSTRDNHKANIDRLRDVLRKEKAGLTEINRLRRTGLTQANKLLREMEKHQSKINQLAAKEAASRNVSRGVPVVGKGVVGSGDEASARLLEREAIAAKKAANANQYLNGTYDKNVAKRNAAKNAGKKLNATLNGEDRSVKKVDAGYDLLHGTLNKVQRDRVASNRKNKEAIRALNGETEALKRNNRARQQRPAAKPTRDTGGISGQAGQPFSAKLLTTAQYAVAGAAIYAVAQAARAGAQAVVDFDLAIRTMSAVLDESLETTTKLGQELNEVGKVLGGTQKEIYDVATALGRAGTATEDLVEATEVTIKLARLTGDSFDTATNAVISYNQVFKDTGITVEALGDKIALAANESRLSIEDIGTFSNFALSAATSVNFTVDSLLSLGAAFSNAGVSASTVGTQIRSLTRIFTDQSDAVQGLFRNLGVVQGNLLADIQKGGAAGDQALVKFGKQLKKFSTEDFANFTRELNIRERDALNKFRQNIDEFERFVKRSANASEGTLNDTDIIVQSFQVNFENAVNSMKDAVIDGLFPSMDNLSLKMGEVAGAVEIAALKFKQMSAYVGESSGYDWGNLLGPLGILVQKVAESKTQLEGVAKAEQYLLGLQEERVRLRLRLLQDQLALQEASGTYEKEKLKALVDADQRGLDHLSNEIDKQIELVDREKLLADIRDLNTRRIKEGTAAYDKQIKAAKEALKVFDAASDKRKAKSGKPVAKTVVGDAPPPVDTKAFLDYIRIRAKADEFALASQNALFAVTKKQLDFSVTQSKTTIDNTLKDKAITKELGKELKDIVASSTTYEQSTANIAKLNQIALELTTEGNTQGRRLVDNLLVAEAAQQKLLKTQASAIQLREGVQARLVKGRLDELNIDKQLATATQQRALGQKTEIGFQEKKLQLLREQLVEAKEIQKSTIGSDKESIRIAAQAVKDAGLKEIQADRDLQVLKYNERERLLQEHLATETELYDSASARRARAGASAGGLTPEFKAYEAERALRASDAGEAGVSVEDIKSRLATFDAAFAAKVDEQEQGTLTGPLGEIGQIEVALNDRLALITSFYSNKLALAQTDAERQALLDEEETARQNAVLTARADQTVTTAEQLASTLENLRKSGLLKSKKAAKAAQALQIVAATAATYSSAVKAYDSTIGIPVAGPFLAPVAAAAAIAAGLANVAQIKAQTFHTGGTVGPNGQKLRSDEVPAILQTGERVLSRQEVAQTQQAPTSNETVIINSMDPAVVESWATSRSGRKIIRNIVNN